MLISSYDSVSLSSHSTHAHSFVACVSIGAFRGPEQTKHIETNQTNRNNLTFIRTQAKPTTTRSKVTRTWRCPNRPCRRHQAPGHRSVIESLNLSPVHDPPVVVPQLEGALEDQTQQDHGSITRSRHVSRADRHVPHASDPPFNLIGLHILRPVRGRICRRRRNVDPR